MAPTRDLGKLACGAVSTHGEALEQAEERRATASLSATAHKGRRCKARRTRGDGTRGPTTNVRVAQPSSTSASSCRLKAVDVVSAIAVVDVASHAVMQGIMLAYFFDIAAWIGVEIPVWAGILVAIILFAHWFPGYSRRLVLGCG